MNSLIQPLAEEGTPSVDNAQARQAPKRFVMRQRFGSGPLKHFSELDAPDWLTSAKTVPGSTMDMRWFWVQHVLTLRPGESVSTDFRIVTRVS